MIPTEPTDEPDPLGATGLAILAELRKIREGMRLRFLLAGAAIIIAFAVAVIGVQSARSANHKLAENAENTAIARLASCQQYNAQQDIQVAAEITQSHDLVATLSRGRPDPATMKAVAAYNLEHDQIIRDGHAHRDCTPAGIAAYLSGATTTTRAQGPTGPQSP